MRVPPSLMKDKKPEVLRDVNDVYPRGTMPEVNASFARFKA